MALHLTQRRIAGAYALSVVFWGGLALVAGRAHAYTWMIRNDYTGCATCHVDPSGFGLLTQYGRAQGELLLFTQYSSPPPGQEREPGRLANFLWGALDWAHIPDWLLLKGSFRGAVLGTKLVSNTVGFPNGPWDVRYTQMQADLYAGVSLGHFRADGNLAVLPSGGYPAIVTNIGSWNLLSREHWIGWEFGDEAFLVRAGRMNLPFGLRNIEHTSFVRRSTRTDVNSFQQFGVALAYTGEKWRGELMPILGNFQISPIFREYGYSGYAELALTKNAAIGVSSLLTYAKRDLVLKAIGANGNPFSPSNLRQAHGSFARYSPIRLLVLLAEWDFLVQSPFGTPAYLGYAGFLQADVEIIQGVHLFETIELFRDRTDGATPSYSFWVTPNWFFAPHADIRVDLLLQRQVEVRGSATAIAFVAMLHFYL